MPAGRGRTAETLGSGRGRQEPEQLRIVSLADQRPGGFDVALADEGPVGVHPVDLHRDPLGPAGAELRHWHAGIVEESPPSPGRGLGQALGREHPQ